MKTANLLILFILLSIYTSAQSLMIEAPCASQTIESFTAAMDEGVHAIHLQVESNDQFFKVSSGSKLSDVIKAIEWHTKSYTRYEVEYILNLSTKVDWKALYELIDSYIPMSRVTVRSSDYSILKYWKKHYPHVKVAVVGNSKKSLNTNLANLGVKPDYYCMTSKALTKKRINSLHKREVQVVAHMISDTTAMLLMKAWKVDRIITDSTHLSKVIGLNKKVKNGAK